MSKKSFSAAVAKIVDIITVEEDSTGVHVVAATDQSLSKDLDGVHFDDAQTAQLAISGIIGRPVVVRVDTNQHPSLT